MCALPEITRILPDSLGRLKNWEDTVLVDVRDIDFYTGYIPGSLHFPWTDFDPSRLCEAYAHQRKRIVFLCYTSQNRAVSCAKQLLLYVREHVSKPKCEISILEGGFQRWEVTLGKDDTTSSYVSTLYNQSRIATEGSLPAYEPLPEVPKVTSPQNLYAHDESLPAEDKLSSELKVGDIVKIYSKSKQMHYHGVIASADENKLRVSFLRDKKCVNRVLSRSSEDIGVVSDFQCFRSTATHQHIKPSYSDGLASSQSTEAEAIDDDTMAQARVCRAKTLSDALALSKALVGQDGGADNNCANHSEWHGQVQIGGYVEMYSHSDNNWQKALVVGLNEAKINLRFFRGGKCCAKVLRRSSEDLRSPLSNRLQLPETQKPLLTKKSGFTTVLSLSPGGQLSNATPTVYAEDLAKSLGNDMLQLIDVRGLDYLRGHIPGARHVPRQFFEQKLPSLANEFAQSGKTLVFYSTESFYRGPQCAQRFLDYINEEYMTHTCQVFVLKGGYERWERMACGAVGTSTPSNKLITESTSATPDALSIYD